MSQFPIQELQGHLPTRKHVWVFLGKEAYFSCSDKEKLHSKWHNVQLHLVQASIYALKTINRVAAIPAADDGRHGVASSEINERLVCNLTMDKA